MKNKSLVLLIINCLFVFSFTSCGNNDYDGTDDSEAFPPMDNCWQLTCENLAQLKPLLIPKKEFVKRVGDIYFVEKGLYQCSDSLGKTCFWNCSNEPSFDLVKGEFYSPILGHDYSELFRLDERNGYRYTQKRHLSGLESDPEKSRPRKINWDYDEKSGEFQITPQYATIDVRERWTLLQLNRIYLILKKDEPMFPSFDYISINATYTIKVYSAINKSDADKYWFTEASYTD